MPKTSFENNQNTAKAIRQRRLELNLTIEEAAKKAGIGTKTWSRYEAGNPIRKDKLNMIIKTLKWREIPEEFQSGHSLTTLLGEYKEHEAWSDYLYQNFGLAAAISFAIGSDLISDFVADDLRELAEKPKGTHIGELGTSFISSLLPEQFLMEYDYEFMYHLSKTIQGFRQKAKADTPLIAHSVLEELCLYLIMEESTILMEDMAEQLSEEEQEEFMYSNTWIFDLFDDMDVYTFLYSDFCINRDNPYHFCHWLDNQFYMDSQ
ncbi:Helix-turn-helix [Streptococcus constellatus]|uniref:Helix-turn-helix n=1 Tax=Streptococcus constellatus TaxID=76860 RepID=A0A564TU56_STRCV|nr:helix-turn-helix transcriptional regulator [Streptococcus constellatus]VUX10789.1 Helix-turn-helix [Streptococcus constellatus]VUX13059.1 Helix-turn-helix [Streptococcus gordonii]